MTVFFAMVVWVALFAALGYGILKKLPFPFNVYGLFFCNGLLLFGVFVLFPIIRDRLSA